MRDDRARVLTCSSSMMRASTFLRLAMRPSWYWMALSLRTFSCAIRSFSFSLSMAKALASKESCG